jgi:UrcA family protein
MLRTFTIAAFLTLTATTAIAGTQPAMDVPYGDLNLSRADDARILAQRLDAAARTVCTQANNPDLMDSKIGQQAMQNCINTAITIAMEQVASHLENKVRANLISAKTATP